MKRPTLFFWAVMGLMPAAAAMAAPTLSFEGLPPIITPGTSFNVTLDLTDATGLNSYNIELILSGSGVAGTDYFFSSAAKPGSRYVFAPDDGNYLSSILPAVQKNHAVISDFLDTSSVDTLAGINDRIAIFTITTAPGFTGSLDLGLAGDSLELLNLDLNPIAGAANVIDHPPSAHLSVPEPQSVLAFGVLLILRRFRRTQRSE